MDKSTYFRAMGRVSTLTWPYIKSAVEGAFPVPSTYSSPRLLAILRLREGRPLLKPFLVYLTSTEHRVCDHQQVPEPALICGAAAELINIASYQCNSALDEKNGVFSPDEKDEQQLSAVLSREATIQLSMHPSIPDSVGAPQLLSDAYSTIARGQLLDLFELTFAKLSAYTDSNHFFSRYALRCELLSGIFTKNCAILGARLGGASRAEEALLAEFGLNLGIAMQIANDIGDLVPPEREEGFNKPYQDSFNDLRNGRLTLPIYLLLKEVKKTDRRDLLQLASSSNLVGGRTPRYQWASTLFACSKAWPATRKLAKSYAQRAKHALHKLPASEAKVFLSCMASIARSNKYNYRLDRLRSERSVLVSSY